MVSGDSQQHAIAAAVVQSPLTCRFVRSVINGHYYSSREASRIHKDGRAIMDQIGTQLAKCPRSVVIMDVRTHAGRTTGYSSFTHDALGSCFRSLLTVQDIQHMDARLLQVRMRCFSL